jgi:3-(3-hydroxy-phenyl)propionate hydroxylase
VLKTYKYPKFAYETPHELRRNAELSDSTALCPEHAGNAGSAAQAGPAPFSKAQVASTVRIPVSTPPHQVVIVGAGPVGMSCAIGLQQQGIAALLIDEDDTVSVGSRGVCYAKRTLEILDRLGVGEQVSRKGVSWHLGRTFFREHEVYRFDLLPEPGHERPAMINLQQYYLEEYLQRRCAEAGVQMRWKQRVDAVAVHADHVEVHVSSPDGPYTLRAAWLVVADGARSPIRRHMGLEVEGRVFSDRFLIADVVMKADFPAERWFWFDPPFHPNQSVLLHRQADHVWRIDFQLGWDADQEEEKKPEKVIPRIRAMLGEERAFELEWVSVYTFQCRRMPRLTHGRVVFAGDAAHQVSPFGARGANSGIQDADNLAWKLARVIHGHSPRQLLESYDQERGAAADENILNSARSTDFITPKSPISRMFRDATLDLARHFSFAQRMVNSGRLSIPTHYVDSPLNTADQAGEFFQTVLQPGSPIPDAPLYRNGEHLWLLRALTHSFALLVAVEATASPRTHDPRSALAGLATWAAASRVQLLLISLVAPASGSRVGAGEGLHSAVKILSAGRQHSEAQTQTSAARPSRVEIQSSVSGRSRVEMQTSAAHPSRVEMQTSATPCGETAIFLGNGMPYASEIYVDADGLLRKRFDLRPGTAYLLRPDQHIAARFRHPEPRTLTEALRRCCGFASAGDRGSTA